MKYKEYFEENTKEWFQVKSYFKRENKEEKKEYISNICKIEIYPQNKETYKILNDYRYWAWKAAQTTVNELFFINQSIYKTVMNNLEHDEGYQSLLESKNNTESKLKILDEDNEKEKKVLNKELKKINSALKKIRNSEYPKVEKECIREACDNEIEEKKLDIDNYIYRVVSKKVNGNIPAGGIMNGAIRDAKAKLDLNEVNRGNKAVPSFKREKQNLFFQSKETFWGITKDDRTIIKPSFGNADIFYLKFGRKNNHARSIVNNIFNGEYKMGDSYLKEVKGKWYLYLVYNHRPETHGDLDPNIVMGIDIGIATPLYCGLNNSLKRRRIGDGNAIVKQRREIYNIKRSMQKQSEINRGGHGRRRKMKRFYNIKKREANYFETLNHKFSKIAINFALKNNVGKIRLEYLEGFLKDSEENMKSKYLRDWTFYSLQKKIEYKAKMHGIKVEYVDPYHTSQICNVCGQIGKREGSKFTCMNPKCEMNEEDFIHADYNASINIAQSDRIIIDMSTSNEAIKNQKEVAKNKCMYHILKKKEEEEKKKENKKENNKMSEDSSSEGATPSSNSQENVS